MVKFSIKEEYDTNIDNIFMIFTKEKFLDYLKKYDKALIECYIERTIKEKNLYKNITVSILKTDLPSFLSLFLTEKNNKVRTLCKYDLKNKKGKFKVEGKSLDLISATINYYEEYEETKYGCLKIINFDIVSNLPLLKYKIENTLKENFIKSSELRYAILKKWIKKNKKKFEKKVENLQ